MNNIQQKTKGTTPTLGGVEPAALRFSCTGVFAQAVSEWKKLSEDEKKAYTDKFKVTSFNTQ